MQRILWRTDTSLAVDVYELNTVTYGLTSSSFLANNQQVLIKSLARERIKWQFIPAYSPHFGGIWEAGIRSSKFHLKRALGEAHLTYEMLNRLLIQIESVLNSRPMTPLSSDPQDLTPLKPSHFLIGKPTYTVPDPDLMHIPVPRLSMF